MNKKSLSVFKNHSFLNWSGILILVWISLSFSKSEGLFSKDNDIAFPTLVSFSDNDFDNQLQTASEVVFTAVFQSAVTVSPTIEIPGAVSGGQMITSDRLTWYYTWDVSSSGPSNGNYTARVRVTDPDNMSTNLVGSPINFTLDNSVPTVVLTDTDSDDRLTIYDNIRITATFSQPMASSH